MEDKVKPSLLYKYTVQHLHVFSCKEKYNLEWNN